MRLFAIILVIVCYGCDAVPAYHSPSDTALQKAADQRVQKVIVQLKAECDSNLQKETYKRVQERLQQWRQKHTRPKG